MTLEEHLKLIIGHLTIENAGLRAEVDKLRAELDAAKKDAPT